VFLDRFNSLDEAQLWAVSDGWSNGSWTANDWRRRQLRTGAEGLEITLAARRNGGAHPYASGEVSTHQTYRYGYFEARLRMPRGSGLVGGVFTFTRDGGAATWNEIDMEILGRDTRSIELSYVVRGTIIKQVLPLPFDAADGFHTYAFDWRPDVIRWYVDDELLHESREADVTRLNQPQRFILNLWNSEELQAWVGPIAHDSGPWTMTVSCVAHASEYPGRSLCEPDGETQP
jgi:beta-glucanase (GH16 family)